MLPIVWSHFPSEYISKLVFQVYNKSTNAIVNQLIIINDGTKFSKYTSIA